MFRLLMTTFADDCGTILLNGFCSGGEIDMGALIHFVINLLTAGIVVAGTIGVILCGYTILTAADRQDKIAKSKKRIVEIVVGLALWVTATALANFLIPGFTGTADNPGMNLPTVSMSNPEYTQVETKESEDTITPSNGGSGGSNSSGSNSGNNGSNSGSSKYYSPSEIDQVVSVFNSMENQDWTELKNYAYQKYGIHEDNFIGMVAWARIENYENHDISDKTGIYMAYLCNNVGLNRALQAESEGKPSGWLDTMLEGGRNGWGSVYNDSRYYGSQNYYQSNLKLVRMAMDYHYPGITNCSGTRPPAGKSVVYTWGPSLIW